MTQEELEKELQRTKDQLFRLVACLYPNVLGKSDLDYIVEGNKEQNKTNSV